MGIDQLAWHLNGAARKFSSIRFRPNNRLGGGRARFDQIRPAVWELGGESANALPRDVRHPARLFDAAGIHVGSSSLTGSPGEALPLDVRVTNIGTSLWLAGSGERGTCRLGYRIFRREARTETVAEGRAPLGRDLAPGDEATIPLALYAPERPGDYDAEIDVVNEFRWWFADCGSEPLRIPLRVEQVPRGRWNPIRAFRLGSRPPRQ